tara:strand:- start:533 stop:1087 length:555 start_codon:yes stop_codon:yes gene_type:complete
MTNKKDWKVYCEKTFNNLKANSHNWERSSNWDRAITRDFYIGVFDCGNPNPTGLISENAFQNKLKKTKTVHDHCLSPQFIGRMIMDDQSKYLDDYEIFEKVFWYACRTIIVTQRENEALSDLTSNKNSEYKIFVPTNLKYNYLDISLYKRDGVKKQWKHAQPIETNVLEVPSELLEYEKQYLTN